MILQVIERFPLLDDHDDVGSGFRLRRDIGFQVDPRRVFNTSLFAADLLDNLVELGEKGILFSRSISTVAITLIMGSLLGGLST